MNNQLILHSNPRGHSPSVHKDTVFARYQSSLTTGQAHRRSQEMWMFSGVNSASSQDPGTVAMWQGPHTWFRFQATLHLLYLPEAECLSSDQPCPENITIYLSIYIYIPHDVLKTFNSLPAFQNFLKSGNSPEKSRFLASLTKTEDHTVCCWGCGAGWARSSGAPPSPPLPRVFHLHQPLWCLLSIVYFFHAWSIAFLLAVNSVM